MMRVEPPDSPQIAVTVLCNDEVIMKQVFDTTPQRTWHEAFHQGIKETGNILRIKAEADAPLFTFMWCSDVVILYQADTDSRSFIEAATQAPGQILTE